MLHFPTFQPQRIEDIFYTILFFILKRKPRFDRDRIKLKLWEDIGKEFIGFYIIGEDDMEMDSQLIEDIQDEKEELSFLLYRVRITTFFSLPFLMSLLEYTKKNPGVMFFIICEDVS